jgi:twitching motility protein PilT
MPEAEIRYLLGEILSAERDAQIKAGQRIELEYTAAKLGTFHVMLAQGETGLEATFKRKGAASLAVDPVAVESRAVAAPAPAPAKLTAPQPVPTYNAPAPTASAFDELIIRAATLRATDLHIAEHEVPFLRVDGSLRALSDSAISGLLDILPLDSAQRERAARGDSVDLALSVRDEVRVRLHVFTAATGLVAAARLLPKQAPSLASLDLPMSLENLIDLPHGLVLICGAAGSGKSTTLAALVQEVLRRRSVVVITLEDPIEYHLTASQQSLVRRRQVGRDVADFPTGLRDALREDPDVLVVGEMRDAATISLALTAAETGHLVFATLHSRSAASAVERIVDSFPGDRQQQVRVQLAESLREVVSQRLVVRARGERRIPALEVMRVTHAVGTMIREGKTAQIPIAIQSGRAEGMIALERCLADRVQAGVIRLEDARAAANDPALLTMYLSK